MEIVIEQERLQKERYTFQSEVVKNLRCRKCKLDSAKLFMQIIDKDGELVRQKNDEDLGYPGECRVWPHDSSVTNVYLCTICGSMRANWNQG